MQWEYMVHDVNADGGKGESGESGRKEIKSHLDKLGSDGWELVSVVRTGDSLRHYLKKPTSAA